MSSPSPQPAKIRAHVFVSGMVQGVGYRFSTVRKAQQLGINGWVRNLPDSRVEAVFEGTQAQLDAMIRWCYQGSSGAIVEEVAVEYEQPEGIHGFETRR